MTIETWQLVFSIIGTILVVIALLSAHYRFMMTMLNKVRQECENETKALHQRVNDVRDAYVRKEDLHIHLQPIQHSIDRLGDEVHRAMTRIDRIIGTNSTPTEG